MERNEDFVANFKFLLFSALYQWKKIVAVALVLGIAIGGVQAYLRWQGSSGENTTAQLSAEDENLLNEQKYWAEVAEQNYQRQREYIDNSILMRIDYRETHKASATYYIDTNYQIQPGSTYQDIDHTKILVSLYTKYLQDQGLNNRIAEELGIKPRYMQELIRVTAEEEGSLTVSVLYLDTETAEKIMEMLAQEISAAYSILNETVCAHSLTKLLDFCGVCVDTDVSYEQRASRDRLQEYQTKVTQSKDEYEKTQVRLNVSAPGTVGAKGLAKTFVKWAVLGGALGAVLAVLVIWMGMIFSDKITSEKKLAEKLSLAVLGTIVEADKKQGCFARWLRKIEGRRAENTEENARYIAQNLLNHAGDAKTVLVCSDAGIEMAELAVCNLQKHTTDTTLLAAGSLTRDAQALKQLQDADAVVLVVAMGKSYGKEIGASMKQIRQVNKPVAGIVAVD